MKIFLSKNEVAIAVSNYINKIFVYDDGMGRHYLAQKEEVAFDRYSPDEFAIWESKIEQPKED